MSTSVHLGKSCISEKLFGRFKNSRFAAARSTHLGHCSVHGWNVSNCAAGRLCSVQAVFSTGCVQYSPCSVQAVFSTGGVQYRLCSEQAVFSTGGVQYRWCSVQAVFSKPCEASFHVLFE
jgi:hypothetical protein